MNPIDYAFIVAITAATNFHIAIIRFPENANYYFSLMVFFFVFAICIMGIRTFFSED